MTIGEQEPDWRVVLDANVLLQAPMRDTLLRLAELNVLGVFWAVVADTQELLLTSPIAAHDRHVLACAIAAPAEIIVTYNTRHFPRRLLNPYRKRAWHPDDLLRAVLRHRPDTLRAVLTARGAGMTPARTLTQVIDRLACDAPRFATRAREEFGL